MKILVVGAFDFINYDSGGQPVKTRELFYALQDHYGISNVSYFETNGWQNKLCSRVINLIKSVRKVDVVIILPAVNGIKVLPYILMTSKRRKTKLFYSVIGGWLSKELHNRKLLSFLLKQFNGIWVETSSMKEDLEQMGFANIAVVKNFKRLNLVNNNDFDVSIAYPLRLCTFSRVIEQKGITDAINAVRHINSKKQKDILSLDIYGPIDEGYKDKFLELQHNFPPYIRYMGEAKPNESVEILRNYFALLFPTKFYTEGIPGTIIDAYSAGIPIITSLWKNYADVFINNQTGLGYKFNDYQDFVSKLEIASNDPSILVNMKQNCLTMAYSFTPKNVMTLICNLIDKS